MRGFCNAAVTDSSWTRVAAWISAPPWEEPLRWTWLHQCDPVSQVRKLYNCRCHNTELWTILGSGVAALEPSSPRQEALGPGYLWKGTLSCNLCGACDSDLSHSGAAASGNFRRQLLPATSGAALTRSLGNIWAAVWRTSRNSSNRNIYGYFWSDPDRIPGPKATEKRSLWPWLKPLMHPWHRSLGSGRQWQRPLGQQWEEFVCLGSCALLHY